MNKVMRLTEAVISFHCLFRFNFSLSLKNKITVMNRILFVTILIAQAASSQVKSPEYVVLEEHPPLFSLHVPTQELQVDKNLIFKESDRAERRYNAYFSRPVDLRQRFADCRYAYEPDAYTMATTAVQHAIFPEVKW
jgi:hypothetical protein